MKRRGLLLDRDGVINIDRQFVGKRDQFEFIEGVFPFLRAAQDMGFRLAILTNQSGVARGYYTAEDYENLTAWMLKELAKQGITIELVLHCFEYAEGSIAEYKRESFWRKPSPGMVLEAIQRLDLDPVRSVFLGDKVNDVEAAASGGIGKRVLLNTKEASADAETVASYDEVLKILKAIASA